MKKIILISGIAILLFANCERRYEPIAYFTVDNNFPEPGEVIQFNNKSSNYTSLYWDFGDGTYSNDLNPVHWYPNSGIYKVVLTAFGDEGEKRTSQTITVDYATPVTDFYTDYLDFEPNDEVVFYNNSSQATDYFWEFGDGTTSKELNPVHSYSSEGVYTVTLSAYNGDKADVTSLEIYIYITTLEVEVREYYSEDLISDIEVSLYGNYTDWENFSNPILSGTTDESGFVIFKGLNTVSYYIDAWSDFYNNESLGLEDINFVKTLPLEYARHNIFTAYVDYIPPAMKAANAGNVTERPVRKMVVKEVKRSVKDTGKVLQRVRKKK